VWDRGIGGGFDEPTVVKIGAGAAAGLAHLPSLGIMHRDLKPANMVMEDLGGCPRG